MSNFVNVTLPYIPNEAATELVKFRDEGWSNERIYDHVRKSEDGPLKSVLEDQGFDVFTRVLVEGYIAKGTPHQEIHLYYSKAKKLMGDSQFNKEGVHYQVNNARTQAVEYVLNELGIEILGVNVHPVE